MSIRFTQEEWALLSPAQKQTAITQARLDLSRLTRSDEVDYPSFVAGKSFDASPVALAPTTITLTPNLLRAYFLRLERDTVIAAMRINVTAGVVSTTMRIGLYDIPSAQFYPNNLVTGTDNGTIDTDATGVKVVTLPTPILVRAGAYALAYNTDGASTVTGIAVGGVNKLPDADEGMPGNSKTAWSGSLAYGPLPAQFPTGYFSTSVVVPQVLFRVA